MDGTELQAPAIKQRAVDSDRVVRARELVPVGALEQEVGKGEVFVEPLQNHEVLLHLLLCVLLGGMASVRFEEMDLAYPDECPGLLRLVTEGVDQLVGFERQVGM